MRNWRTLPALGLGAAVITACASGSPVGGSSDPLATTALPSASSIASPKPILIEPAGTTYPEGWTRYTIGEAGVTFAFPPLPGRAKLDRVVADDGPGEGVHVFLKVHHGYDIFGTSSRWATAGRECEASDAYSWSGDEESVTIRLPEIAENCHYTIDPIEIHARADGLEAVVFDLGQYLLQFAHPGEEPPASRDLVAILRLPEDHHPLFRSLTFVFDIDGEGRPFEQARLPDTTLEDVRTVLDSVEFLDPS